MGFVALLLSKQTSHSFQHGEEELPFKQQKAQAPCHVALIFMLAVCYMTWPYNVRCKSGMFKSPLKTMGETHTLGYRETCSLEQPFPTFFISQHPDAEIVKAHHPLVANGIRVLHLVSSG